MARSRPEWIGATDDAKVPTRVRMRVFLAHDGVCHISKTKIMVGEEWDLEHIRPLSMGGQHRESNLAPAKKQPHREKTAREAADRSKADRIHAKHHGYWPKSRATIKGRGFAPTRARIPERQP